MPGDSSAGASAEVGVRKIDDDGNTVQEEGYLEGINWARVMAFIVFVLAGFGLWRVVEIMLMLV